MLLMSLTPGDQRPYSISLKETCGPLSVKHWITESKKESNDRMHVDVPWYEAPSKQTPFCTNQEQIPRTHKKFIYTRRLKGQGPLQIWRMTKSRKNFLAFKDV